MLQLGGLFPQLTSEILLPLSYVHAIDIDRYRYLMSVGETAYPSITSVGPGETAHPTVSSVEKL